MSRRLPTLMVVFLLSATLFAGDPWKEKPYQQWDEKDVRRILSDSPWAREVVVGASWRAGTRPVDRTATPADDRTSGVAAAGRAPDEGGAAGEPEQGAGAPPVRFVVTWASARTVRQAFARKAVLRGTPEARAQEFLAKEPAEYAVTVIGEDMTPFAKADEAALKERSYLLLKKTKQKLAPSRVEIRRAAQKISALVFYFVRKSASGEPVIAADEKQIEFVCEPRGAYLKAKFEPQKMTGAEGLDL